MEKTINAGLPHWTVVGFTGHRTLASPDIVYDCIATTLNNLASEYGSLVTMSSAASGADTLFLEAANTCQFPLQIILPFDNNRFSKDFTAEQWQRVEPLINRSIEKTIVGSVTTANEAYLECGVYTVDRCDILLAVWDSKSSLGEGGTGDVVGYARSIGQPLIIIDPTTGQVTRENLEIKKDMKVKLAPPAEQLRDTITQSYIDFDQQATKTAPKARGLMIWIIFLHLFVSALAITGVILQLPDPIPLFIIAGKVATLILALFLIFLHHRIQHKWINARPSAELCRLFLAIWPLRREGAPTSTIGLGEHQRSYRDLVLAWQIDKNSELPFHEAQNHYHSERIDNQLVYYKAALKTAAKYYKWIRRLATSSTWLAIIAGSIVLVMELLDFREGGYKSVKLLSIVLPMLAAALLSFGMSHDLGRRAIRYQEMIDRLKQASVQVSTARTWPSLWRAVDTLERDLFAEIGEWKSTAIFLSKSH